MYFWACIVVVLCVKLAKIAIERRKNGVRSCSYSWALLTMSLVANCIAKSLSNSFQLALHLFEVCEASALRSFVTRESTAHSAHREKDAKREATAPFGHSARYLARIMSTTAENLPSEKLPRFARSASLVSYVIWEANHLRDFWILSNLSQLQM